MANFTQAFKKLAANEGGYANDPDDLGGETYKGISRVIWGKKYPFLWKAIDELHKEPSFPNNLDMNDNLQTMVRMFYQDEFWKPIDGDNIKNDDIAFSVFDFAVNAGISTSKELARLALSTSKYSTDAINAIEYEQFMTGFTLAKIARYIYITQRRPKNKKFFFGWIVRAMDVKFKKQ